MPYELKSQEQDWPATKFQVPLEKKSHLTKMSAQQSKEQKKRMHLSKNNRERETGATNR